jgi:hypothetical protein
MYLGVIRSRPTAYNWVTIQHNHLNRKNTIQNQKLNRKNNIKLIHLTFIHCTNKQIVELTDSWALQTITKMMTDAPINAKGPKRHAHARATLADSVPPRSL